MHLYCFLKKKNYDTKRSTFSNFYRSSLIHKNKPALVAKIVLKKSTSTVFVRFLKNTLNFTRSCAFAQKAKFYALKMLRKQILTHPKAAKLATLNKIDPKPGEDKRPVIMSCMLTNGGIHSTTPSPCSKSLG